MQTFEQNIIATHGAAGRAWLDSLPKLAQQYVQLWGLKDVYPEPRLSFNYLLAGFRAEKPVILKLSIDHAALAREAAALQAFAGYGAVAILEKTAEAILLERAVPGKTLNDEFSVDDLQAIQIACDLTTKLHQAPIPKQHAFPHLADWFATLDQDWDIPREYLLMAREIRSKLLRATKQQVLLHGDLHQDNILSNADGWLIIDPKGVIGDPAFDNIGCLIREPLAKMLQRKDITEILNSRIALLSQNFELDVQHTLEWAFAVTILAACWCVEDKHDPSQMLNFAAHIRAVM